MAPTLNPAWTSSWQLNVGQSAKQRSSSEEGFNLENLEVGLVSSGNKDLLEGALTTVGTELMSNAIRASFEGGVTRVGELVELIQLRDAEKAREAASQCRRGLEADETGEFLRMLANESADWTGLFHAWEIHHAASNHKVCQQLLLLLAELLRHPLGRASRLQQLSPSEPAREEATLVHSRLDGLARNVVRKRMKQVYGHLTSGHKGRANACLMLLTAINGRGKSLSSELVGTFDFTLSSLAKLASPPKQSGKQEREGGNNPEKRSTRAVFIDFALSFLLVGDPLTTRSALQKRSLFTPVLQNLYTDSAEQITRVLNALKDHVLPETAGVPARLQGALFGDLAIEQLINIAAFDDASDVSLTQPATLAYEVLVQLFSSPSHGVCPAPQPAAAKKTKDVAAQSRLVRALLKLKATDVQRHSDLLIAATQAQPSSAAAYLGAFPYSLEPRTSDRWYAAMALLRKLVTFASQAEVSQAHDATSVKALLHRVVPPALPRALLSRGIQHRSSSIKFVSLAVLSSILDSLHILQRRLQAASVPTLKELTDQARLLLPDPQVLLALNTAIEKGDINQPDAETNEAREGLQNDPEEEEESISTEELHLKLLEVLAGYQRCLPDALAACRFNPTKLLPENPALLPRAEQAALLNLLLAVSEAATSDSALMSASTAPQILPLLRLMLGAASKDLSDKAKSLVHQTLLATGVFSSHLEVATWHDFLPHWDAHVEARAVFSLSDTVAAFLSDAVTTVSKNPYRSLERVQEALSAWTLLEVPQQQSETEMQWEASNGSAQPLENALPTGGGTSGPEFGPLVVCSLEKCLKVLSAGGLTAKPDSLGLVRKTGIAQYTAAALRQLMLVQRDPEPLAAVVESLLGELNDEASSCCEWAPLFSLQHFARALLSKPHKSTQLPQLGGDTDPPTTSLGDVIAVFSSAEPPDRPQLVCALGYALLTSPPSEFAQKLPELTSAMTSSESAVLVDLLKMDSNLLPAFAQSHPDMLQRALKAVKKLGRGPILAEELTPLAGLLLSLPFATVLSAVGSSSHPEFSMEAPGVKSLLQRLLSPNQRATAVRMLLHFLDAQIEASAESSSSKIDVVFALLRQAVFTPEPSSLADADVMLDALQHPALANRFLSQHDVSELDGCIALFVRDALSALHLGRDSEGVTRQVERACSQYVRRAVEVLERRLPGDLPDSELDAVLMLVPFDDTPSLLRLLDLLLPKPSVNLSQTPGGRTSVFQSPILRTLTLQLASKIFSSDLTSPLENTRGASTASAEADSQKTALPHAELYQRVANLALLDESKEVDACLLGALQSADRAVYEAACQAMGLSSERQPLLDNGVNLTLQLKPEEDPEKVSLSSSELAKSTPIGLVTKYVEQPTRTRAKIATFLVRRSTKHRLEFGRQLRDRLSALTAGQKLILAPAVEVFLAAAKDTAAEHPNEESDMQNVQEDTKSIAEAYRDLVTGFLCKRKNEQNNGTGSTEETASEARDVLANGSRSEEPVSSRKKRKRKTGELDGAEEDGLKEALFREPNDWPSKKSKHEVEQNGQIEGFKHKRQNGAQSEEETRGNRETSEGFVNSVELFKLCSVWAPLSETERKRLLKKLLPKDGWGLQPSCGSTEAAVKEGFVAGTEAQHTTSKISSKSRIRAAHILQQAAVARILVIKKVADSADGSGEEKQEQVDGKDLIKYAQILMTSLKSLHSESTEAKSGGQIEEVGAELERALLVLLGEAAGLLGGLDKQLAAVTSFASSVVQSRSIDASSLRVARVLLTSVKEGVNHIVVPSKESEQPSGDLNTADEHTASTENGDLKSGDASQEVALIGSTLFKEAVSAFMPTLLVSKLGTKPLPESMGKHSGDFVPSSLSSILSLLDTPAPPKMQSRLETEMGESESGQVDTCLSGSIRLLLSTPEKSQSEEKKDVTSSSKGPENPSRSRSAVKQNGREEAESVRLELVRLLSTFLDLRSLYCQSETLSTDELLSTLLGAYGATMSDVDRQMLHLMRQIDGQGGVGALGLAGMDYLWGERAMQSRQERRGTGLPLDPGARARLFREESPLDPRRCGLTVLYFPVRRGVQPLQADEGLRKRAEDPEEDLKAAAYDPSFLLPYAVHVLKTGAMDARDFARSGLLQVALASLAAADEGMRKAGYSVLALYMNLLEDPATSFREKQQVRLLLHYVRNAVTQPLQRIPMTSAVFAAEACCIQMHPEHQLYAAINKFILKRPALDLEDIPLFYNLFNSGSPNYRTERVWMLRLLGAGLVTSADGRVFRRRFVLELLMSFAGSAMADAFTRRLVMQVFRRAVQVQKCASDLVDHAGLVPWLANLVLFENDAGVLAGMALEGLEVLLAAASDDWSRDAAFDDFLAAVKSIHQKLSASEKTAATLAITVPFLRLAAKLAKWSGRRKRSLGPVFSARELSALLSYASAHQSLDAVRWALQLLVLLPLKSQSNEQELRHVIKWGNMAAVVLQADEREPFLLPAKTWANKVKSELPSFAKDQL